MKHLRQKGQVMILSVLLISSAVLGAATIAGLLVIFQLRQTADAETSAQAVFAADAGMERALYDKYKNPAFVCSDGLTVDSSGVGDIFSIGEDDVEYKVVFEGADCSVAKSAGRSARSARAFILYLDGIKNFGGQFLE